MNNDNRCQENWKKSQIFVKTAENFVVLKSWKTIHYIEKLNIKKLNLLSNPWGGSLAPEAGKTYKPTKIFKKVQIL